jgi:hypothetical protein
MDVLRNQNQMEIPVGFNDPFSFFYQILFFLWLFAFGVLRDKGS